MTADDVRDLFDQSREDDPEEPEESNESRGTESALFGDDEPDADSGGDGPTESAGTGVGGDGFVEFVSTERTNVDGTGDDLFDPEEPGSGSSSTGTDVAESGTREPRAPPSPTDDPGDASPPDPPKTPVSDDQRNAASFDSPETPARDDPGDAASTEPLGSPSTEDRDERTSTVPVGTSPEGESDDYPPVEGARTSPAAEHVDAEDVASTAAFDGVARPGRTTSGSSRTPPANDEPAVDADHAARDDPEASRTTGPDASPSGTTADATSPTKSSGSNRLVTGIDELDRAMDGGVPPGRLVVLVTDPGVQSELIVDNLLAQRDTLFVTTDRPEWEVTKDIEPGLGSGEVAIRDHTPDSLLSGVDSLLDELEPSSNFVLDSVNELELVPRQRYRRFLSDVKRRLFDTGSVGLLTGVTVGHESARDLTLRRADVVWRLETRTSDHGIQNRLYVPKFRGGAAVTETIELELTDEVRVASGPNDE